MGPPALQTSTELEKGPVFMVAPFLFFLLAIVAIAAAFGLIFSKNPMVSALWLVLNLFCIAGLYLTLHAQFIGVIQIIVYAGAIMVLFLFVIMLLNLGKLPELSFASARSIAAFALGAAVLAQLLYMVAASFDLLPAVPVAETAAETGTARAVGLVLFTQYALPLQIIAILLLVATIGAVILAKRRFTCSGRRSSCHRAIAFTRRATSDRHHP